MYVVMKLDKSAVGGLTHMRDFTRKAEAEKFTNGASGMTLMLWTKKEYEDWYQRNIKPYYS